jgi:hypothetical protein
MTKKNNHPKAVATPTSPGVYFLELRVENVRCFGPEQILDLSDGEGRPARWTILLGNNGIGKTTLLQSLAALESPPPTDHWIPRLAAWDMQGKATEWRRSGQKRFTLMVRVAEASGLDLPREAYRTDNCRLTLKVAEIDRVWPEGSLHDREYAPSGPDPRPPVCYGYGAARRLGAGALVDLSSDDAVATLFSDRAELRNAEEWLLQLDYAWRKASGRTQERYKERLAQIEGLLSDILPEVEGTRFTTVGEVRPTSRVEFQMPYGCVPLRQLGYGYQTLIAWMVDFASRMVERYPDSPNPIAEPAVVLVDEIDLHLHPLWQRKLIGFLTERFPNTQFIATAHSPLIVQAAADANLVVLRREGDHIVIENDVATVRNWRIDQVLTSDLFGLPTARPPQIEEALKQRDALLSKSRLSARDKEELARLEEEIGGLPGGETLEHRELLTEIQQTLKVLKARQGS